MQKAPYGHYMSSAIFIRKLIVILKADEYEQASGDNALLRKSFEDGSTNMLVVYVDDIIATETHLEMLWGYLAKYFAFEHPRPVHWFPRIGIAVEKGEGFTRTHLEMEEYVKLKCVIACIPRFPPPLFACSLYPSFLVNLYFFPPTSLYLL